nr:hypothetical protein [Tanacetum cinerariifolium]
GELGGLLPLAGLLLGKGKQPEAAADARSSAHRGDEAQLVAAVVDAHRHALDHRRIGDHARQQRHQRQGEKAMRHRAAERGSGGGDGI